MARPVLLTAPETEPITLEEAKAHLNVTSTTKDAFISGLITTARRRAERYLQRALITQTWRLYLSHWHDCIELPYPPLVSVTSIKYKDLEGAEQTLDHQYYSHIVTSGEPGYIKRQYDAVYPEVQYGNPDAIVIEYVAGYGDADAVPSEIKDAMKLMITDQYEHRGTVVIGSIANKIPNYLNDLIHTYKIYSF